MQPVGNKGSPQEERNPPSLHRFRILFFRYECTVCLLGDAPAKKLSVSGPVTGFSASPSCTVKPQCTAEHHGGCSCPLPGLTPNSIYSVHCVAIQADGSRSAQSNDGTFATSQAP